MRIYRLPLLSAALALLAACGGGGDTGSTGSGGGGGGGAGSVGASGLPLYVLIGGSAKPAGNFVYLDSPTTRGNGVPSLNPGEIFIIPQDPLLVSRSYDVSVTAAAGADTFAHNWRFTTGATNSITSQGTPLGEINALRAQGSAAIPAFTTHAGYVTSAVKHAGYQAEVAGGLTHGETNTPTRQFFVANNFWDRIAAGCTTAGDPGSGGWGTDNALPMLLVGEDIASNGGPAAIANLWNTVYHRLPMMRSQYRRLGLGDQADAAAHASNSPTVITAASAFLTIDFGGRSDHAQLGGYWPTDNQTNVYFSFLSDNEGPDPIGGGNLNGTPTDNAVGVPIHVIVPTTNDFTSFTITVTLVP